MKKIPKVMKVGDRVVVCDHSEAHGDIGTIYIILNNGIILVDLEECLSLWPVYDDELELI